jgi:hypothetical protein
MPRNQEWHELNDRVTALAARLAALDGKAEDGLQPAVMEEERSAAVAVSKVGREMMARVDDRPPTTDDRRRTAHWCPAVTPSGLFATPSGPVVIRGGPNCPPAARIVIPS